MGEECPSDIERSTRAFGPSICLKQSCANRLRVCSTLVSQQGPGASRSIRPRSSSNSLPDEGTSVTPRFRLDLSTCVLLFDRREISTPADFPSSFGEVRESSRYRSMSCERAPSVDGTSMRTKSLDSHGIDMGADRRREPHPPCGQACAPPMYLRMPEDSSTL